MHGRNCYIRQSASRNVIFNAILTSTFLYSQFLWAAGYDLYRILEEAEIKGFKSSEAVISQEARKDYLIKKQEEINKARNLFQRGQPGIYSNINPNKEVSKNLFYQKIIANKELAEGKQNADEITNRIGAYGKYYVKHKDGMKTWYFNALLTDIYGEKEKAKSLVEACAALKEILTAEQKEKLKELWQKCKKDMKCCQMSAKDKKCPMKRDRNRAD
jgi:hypothetical protein